MKKIVIIILCFIVWECDKKPVKNQEETKKFMQETANSCNEDIELLAAKYGIESNKLFDIIDEYQKLTQGWGLMKFTTDGIEKRKNPGPNSKIVDIPTAIEIISSKYQIQKATIGSIIVDYKVLDNIMVGRGA